MKLWLVDVGRNKRQGRSSSSSSSRGQETIDEQTRLLITKITCVCFIKYSVLSEPPIFPRTVSRGMRSVERQARGVARRGVARCAFESRGISFQTHVTISAAAEHTGG